METARISLKTTMFVILATISVVSVAQHPESTPAPAKPRHVSARVTTSICGQLPIPTVKDFKVRSVVQVSEPAPRTPYLDPAYGACVVRVTDRDSDISPGDSSPGLIPEYSRVQAFNADDSRFMIRGTEGSWYLYDSATLSPLMELPISDEPRWHPTIPSRLYFVDDVQLRSYDVETHQVTKVHDFAADFPGQSLARVSTRYEGGLSRDGRFWGAMAQNENWDPVAFVVFDLIQGRTIATRDLRGVSGVNDGIDFVSISPSGSGSLGSDQQPCGLMAYDRNLSHGRGLLRFAAHSDTALDGQGREVAVFQDIDTDHISTVDLATGQVVDLWPIDFSHTAIGLHFSGRAFDVPGWALVSTHDDDLGSHTWMDDQVFAMELKPGGRVIRLAHTHSVTVDGAHGAYWAEPHATVNRTFTRVLFGTNWNRVGTEEVETYLIDLPAGWIQKGGTP